MLGIALFAHGETIDAQHGREDSAAGGQNDAGGGAKRAEQRGTLAFGHARESRGRSIGLRNVQRQRALSIQLADAGGDLRVEEEAAAAPVGVAGEHGPLARRPAGARLLLVDIAGIEGQRAAVASVGRIAPVKTQGKAEAGIAIPDRVGVGFFVQAEVELLPPQRGVARLPGVHAQGALARTDRTGRLIGQRDGERARSAGDVGRELRIDILIERLSLGLRQRHAVDRHAGLDDRRTQLTVIGEREIGQRKHLCRVAREPDVCGGFRRQVQNQLTAIRRDRIGGQALLVGTGEQERHVGADLTLQRRKVELKLVQRRIDQNELRGLSRRLSGQESSERQIQQRLRIKHHRAGGGDDSPRIGIDGNIVSLREREPQGAARPDGEIVDEEPIVDVDRVVGERQGAAGIDENIEQATGALGDRSDYRGVIVDLEAIVRA